MVPLCAAYWKACNGHSSTPVEDEPLGNKVLSFTRPGRSLSPQRTSVSSPTVLVTSNTMNGLSLPGHMCSPDRYGISSQNFTWPLKRDTIPGPTRCPHPLHPSHPNHSN